jgi:hypothetical protein
MWYMHDKHGPYDRQQQDKTYLRLWCSGDQYVMKPSCFISSRQFSRSAII